MSNPGEANATPLESRNQLVEIIEAGCKPSDQWRIGTEHEKFGFRLPNTSVKSNAHVAPFSPPPYTPGGIGELLSSMENREWHPIHDPGTSTIIGLSDGKQAISLEPAGQFELSGAPLSNLHETQKEIQAHIDMVKPKAEKLGYGFAPLGFQPLWRQNQMPWMPKKRYEIMRAYMPKVGTCGLDMMTRTCTVQVNLDFSDERDMSDKMQIGLALQPLTTALFANSPFVDGRPNGWLSNRGRIWLDTDNDRAGQPGKFLEEGLTFEKYIDWALEVPMYFILRDDQYIDVAGASFKDWMDGKGRGALANTRPTVGDFEDHLTTLFPDVRLKSYIEMRGADSGNRAMMTALGAFWVGLLYSKTSQDEALRLVKKIKPEVFRELRATAPKLGLAAPFPVGGLRRFASELLVLAHAGLSSRGLGEERYLDPLHKIVKTGVTQADYWLDRYTNVWKGDVSKIFLESML